MSGFVFLATSESVPFFLVSFPSSSLLCHFGSVFFHSLVSFFSFNPSFQLIFFLLFPIECIALLIAWSGTECTSHTVVFNLFRCGNRVCI
jgi:hypothetical protein